MYFLPLSEKKIPKESTPENLPNKNSRFSWTVIAKKVQ